MRETMGVGGWGWERDLNRTPRFLCRFRSRAFSAANDKSCVGDPGTRLTTWQTYSLPLNFAWYERTKDNITRVHVYFISMPVVVYILTKQLLFAVSHLCAYERQSEKDARFNVAHTRVSSCKYSSFARSSFMRLTQDSLAWKRGGRRALFLRPGRIRSVRL